MFHLTASKSDGCPNERSSCANHTSAWSSRRSTTTTWSGRRRRLTYVGSPGDVTDQLHGQVHGTELSCEWLPSRWISLSLTQQIIHEIHHVTSGNRHTFVDQFSRYLYICSIKRLALACMVLGTVSTTSASIPLAGAPKAPSANHAPDPAPDPDSFTATTRTGSLT